MYLDISSYQKFTYVTLLITNGHYKKVSHSQRSTENPLSVDVNDVNGLKVTGKVTNMSKVYETDHDFFTKFKTALKWRSQKLSCNDFTKMAADLKPSGFS